MEKSHTEKTDYHEMKGFDITKANSQTDCTGLIQIAPYTDAQIDSYQDLYPYLPRATGADEHSRTDE